MMQASGWMDSEIIQDKNERFHANPMENFRSLSSLLLLQNMVTAKCQVGGGIRDNPTPLHKED